MIRKILCRFLIVFLAAAVFPCFTAWQYPAYAGQEGIGPLAIPVANMSVSNLVPMEVVEKIALEKATELWGQVTPGEPIPCCDEDGDIIVYMCPFHIGKGPFPDYQQIMEKVKAGRMEVKKVEAGSCSPESAEEPAAESTDTEREAHEEYASDSSYNADFELSGARAPEPPETDGTGFRTALRKARSRMLGIGEYGTIYVSARYDRYPIPLCSHYLSPYYFTGDLARETAGKELGATPGLNRYYFLGYRGQYFEFTAGGNRKLVNAYSLEVESIKPAEKAVLTDEQLADIRREWEKIAGKGMTEKGGDS